MSEQPYVIVRFLVTDDPAAPMGAHQVREPIVLTPAAQSWQDPAVIPMPGPDLVLVNTVGSDWYWCEVIEPRSISHGKDPEMPDTTVVVCVVRKCERYRQPLRLAPRS